LPLSSLLLDIDLGSFADPSIFWLWEGRCHDCGETTSPGKDLFCGNFGACRGKFPVCQKSWHGRCYLASKLETFQIARPENDEGVSWIKTNEEVRFTSSRRGDMLSSPFQCDYCWFVNMKKTTADDRAIGDARLLAYIRRVNLDVMWSSEPSVVKAAWKNLEKGRKISAEFGLPPVDIPVGPWPVADTCGYQIAIEILRASQNPGRNAASYT